MKKGFWKTMLDLINDWNESIKKFQYKMMQKKIDKIIKTIKKGLT